ncbi:hypothetical protein TRFO_05111 [Tritrichomonas foetus]|uniref:Exportin-1 C-terminal domain-containing protein n=1 Tax=Tritrichomonas foetus TaxID=1144522 RepID=A0A1J4KEB4_9EUKA|nr:hypothetical protein TRFO_05111 [Tritrichomonas foetus]|eukprot:OHT07966.1 hypothetical protein TRFO_05111 [Tritrichomonas foetus]
MDLDNLEGLLRQPPSNNGSSYSQIFRNDISNIEICKNILADSNCPNDLQIFLSSTILYFVRNNTDLTELETQFSLRDWCIEILLENCNNFSNNKSVIETISIIFGTLLFELWNDESLIKFNEISRFSGSQLLIICQIYLLRETISIFSINKKKMFRGFSTPIFEKNLSVAFEIAKNHISSNINQLDIVENSLRLIYQCIIYGNDEKVESLQGFRPNIHSLIEEENLEFIFNLYHQIPNERIQQQVLKILQLYLLFDNSTYSNLFNTDFEIISQFLITVLNSINPNSDSNVTNLTNFPDITQILFLYSSKVTSALIGRYNTLISSIVAIYYNTTKSLLSDVSNFREKYHIYENVFNFWSKLSFTFFNHPNSQVRIDFEKYICDITNHYLHFLLHLLSLNDVELYEIIISEISLISPFQKFFNLCPAKIFPIIFEIFKDTQNQLPLALYLKISKEIMSTDSNVSFIDSIRQAKFFVFDASKKIILQSEEFIKDGTESILLEHSILLFLKGISKYGLNGDFLKDNVYDYFFKRTIFSLRMFHNIPNLVSLAIDILGELFNVVENSKYDLNLITSLPTLLIDHFFEFEFLQNDESQKYQIPFFRTVFYITYQYQKLEIYYGYADSLFEKGETIMLTRLLIGILRSKKIHPFLDFINFLIPNKVNYFIEHSKNNEENIPILKMWQYFLNQSNISFPKYSEFGIIIFKSVSHILINSFDYFHFLDNEDITIHLLKRLIPCLSKILNNQFVMFDAFIIYEDPILINLLESVNSFLGKIPIQNIFEYPKVCIAFSHLMPALTRHFNLLPKSIISFISYFYENCFDQPQIHSKEYQTIFSDGIELFMSFINQSQRSDIIDIKNSIHHNLSIIFCRIWEIILNSNSPNYILANSLKELIVYDSNLMDIINSYLTESLSEPNLNEYNEIYIEFTKNLQSRILSSKGLEFKVFVEKIKNTSKSLSNIVSLIPA